jgi:hypothetical protein
MGVTWKAHEKHGELTERTDLPDTVFAFPTERKEPLTDAEHVRNAIARFDQVIDVSDAERAQAFEKIKAAAHPTAWRCPNRNGMSFVAVRRPAARPPIGSARHGRLRRRTKADRQVSRPEARG